jgi:hypothetical protein
MRAELTRRLSTAKRLATIRRRRTGDANASLHGMNRRKPDQTYVIEIDSAPAGTDDRNTIGGRPLLDADQAWPSCRCDTPMVLFFQVDVPTDVPVFGGDHLLVFQCPNHNDACFPPSSELLPERFWDRPPPPNDAPFWRIVIHRGVAGKPVVSVPGTVHDDHWISEIGRMFGRRIGLSRRTVDVGRG